MPSVALRELFKEELAKGIDVFIRGVDVVEVEELSRDEVRAVKKCVHSNAKVLSRISPSIASDFLDHESVFIKFGKIAKALFDGKPISYPPERGKIGVLPIIPQIVKYVASPSETNPAYTSYKNNTWEIDVTAGTPAYIFGDGTHFYRASPESGKRALLVIMQNGLIEIGTTPVIDQFKLWTEVTSIYGIYTVHPLIDLPIESGKMVYQYPTLGVIPVFHNIGIQWSFMPKYSGTVNIRLIGIAFCEYDLVANLMWIA